MKRHVLPLHFLLTALMTGSLCYIHLVHYRLFPLAASAGSWPAYEANHQYLTGLWVMPIMGLELLSALYLLKYKNKALILNFFLLLSIWGLTVFFAAPAHFQLEYSFNSEIHSELMTANLARTLLWITRTALLYHLIFIGPFWKSEDAKLSS